MSCFRNYKDYDKYIHDWYIESIPEASATAYWQYLYAKHEQALAEKWNYKANPETPKGWFKLTEADAKKNLQDIFYMNDDDSDSE